VSELDQQIRDALRTDQSEIMEDEDFAEHLAGLSALLRGRRRWITIFHLLLMAAMTTLAVVSAVQFFRVEETRSMIAWSAGFTVCVILEGILESLFLIEWYRYVIWRDIKRVELQVAILVEHLRKDGQRP